MAAKFGPDKVVLPTGSSDPSGTREAGELFFNTTSGVFKYHDGTDWYKISATVAKLISISGTLYDGKSSTLTLTGEGFLSADLVVNFLQSSDSINVDVTVTPTSDTSASVTVPSSVYSNVTAGNVVTIKVTNSDGSESDTVTTTASAMLGATSSNPASSATALVNDGQTTNGYYYINLGSGAQSIYCILDGSIESGYGYMRVWDAGSSGSGSTVYHWYTGESDNAAFYNTGGWDFAISEFAIRTRGTWSQGPGYSATTITRYTGNGGSGIHSNYSPKTFNTIFNSSWVYSGTENDNYKNFGYTNTSVLNQLYILDDGDTPCGRQTSCTGTPKGVLSFGNPNNLWADHGNNNYIYDQYVMGLYVR